MFLEVVSALVVRALGALWACGSARVAPKVEAAIEQKLGSFVQHRVDVAMANWNRSHPRPTSIYPRSSPWRESDPEWSVGEPEDSVPD